MASIELAGYRKQGTRVAYKLDGFRIAFDWKTTGHARGKRPALDIAPDVVVYRERPFAFPATNIMDIPTLMHLMSGVYRIHVPMGIQIWDNLPDRKIRIGTPHNSQARMVKEFLRFHPRAPLRIFQDSKDNFLDVVWLNDQKIVPEFIIDKRGLLGGRERLATLVRHKPAGFYDRVMPAYRNPLFPDQSSTQQPA